MDIISVFLGIEARIDEAHTKGYADGLEMAAALVTKLADSNSKAGHIRAGDFYTLAEAIRALGKEEKQ